MVKKLYVGGLSYNTTEEALKEGFSEAGTVESAVIIMDKMTGRSKGFGFVEMSSEDEASKAVELFNGKEFDGRRVTVNEAKPPQKREGGFGGGRGGDHRGGGGYRGRD